MANDAAALVQKFWNFCNVLRDDGVSYGDYVEQLTYLLFLKMAEERKPGRPGKPSGAGSHSQRDRRQPAGRPGDVQQHL